VFYTTICLLRMPSSGMLRRVAPTTTEVSQENSAFVIRVTRIGALETLRVRSNPSAYLVFVHSVLRMLVNAKVVPSSPILVIPIMEAVRSSETSIL
jgi:hypothetical protein